MTLVMMTALGVGGATLFGAIIGFIFRDISHKFSDVVLSFAAGIMLSAAIWGLVIPSIECGGEFGVIKTVVGIFTGAVFLNILDKLVPHLHKIAGIDIEKHSEKKKLNNVFLFVMAIAIHNFPEGLAAGVTFGSGDIKDALFIAGGIALQNIPEGMIIIAPMLSVGVSPGKTLLIAAATGLVEVIGTLIGYFAVAVSSTILPYALAFAGGTMIYLVSDEIIPETHAHGSERAATFALLIGFCVMLVTDTLL